MCFIVYISLFNVKHCLTQTPEKGITAQIVSLFIKPGNKQDTARQTDLSFMHGCFSFIMTIFYSLSENYELGISLYFRLT